MRDDEKQKSGSGKSPTKFMKRPGSKPRKEQSEQEVSHPEFINDDLDALENQEKGDADYQGWNPPPAPKSGEKPDQRKSQKPPQKFPESDKRDSSSGDAGDCACP
jgi:hypothetical protein